MPSYFSECSQGHEYHTFSEIDEGCPKCEIADLKETLEAMHRYSDRLEREVLWWTRRFEAYLHTECGHACTCRTLMEILRAACKKACP